MGLVSERRLGMITIILAIMFLFALGALFIGLISFGIWLLPVVIVGLVLAKVLKSITSKNSKPDVVVMSRKDFEANYIKKSEGTN